MNASLRPFLKDFCLFPLNVVFYGEFSARTEHWFCEIE